MRKKIWTVLLATSLGMVAAAPVQAQAAEVPVEETIEISQEEEREAPVFEQESPVEVTGSADWEAAGESVLRELGRPSFTPTPKEKGFIATSSTVRGAQGWEVRFSRWEMMAKATTLTYENVGTKLYRQFNPTLFGGQQYYAQVRCFADVEGERIYSSWSAAKTFVTKQAVELGKPSFTPTPKRQGFVATSSTVRGAKGWEVRFSRWETMAKATTLTYENVGTKLYRQFNPTLFSGKQYYAQVRCFADFEGERIYSSWSESKTFVTSQPFHKVVQADALESLKSSGLPLNQAIEQGLRLTDLDSGQAYTGAYRVTYLDENGNSISEVKDAGMYTVVITSEDAGCPGEIRLPVQILPGNPDITVRPEQGTTSYEKSVIRKIIYAVETGGQVYGEEEYDNFTEAYTNSAAEHAITIGAGQWYATEAKKLLKNIQQANPEEFARLDTAGIAKDLETEDWSKYRITKESDKAKCIVAIIDTKTGHACQDALMDEQLEVYMKEAADAGVTALNAQMMCANFRHQGGKGAVTRILAKTKKPYTLDNLYEACKTDTGNQVGAYTKRQRMVYTELKNRIDPDR